MSPMMQRRNSFLANVISNPKFLYSAFYDFNAQDCMSF